MTDVQIGEAPSRSWVVWLLGYGMFIAIVGLLGGLAAKWSADLTSFAASQPTRVLTPDASDPISSQIAVNFDPSSAHFVQPDYTAFWLGMIVVALGVVAMLGALIVALAKRRMA